ncbi:hypothetical protein TWF106_000540 [Orbilia oligospora]|uniref:EGF-like domain-containing protein n=1 Tax=Orbilia oligospora TaxID=2813651 RepID=A0A7C8UPF9_ORBOL|nr:hypothetical protein TWF106_000540 [Orbilia oligospora]
MRVSALGFHLLSISSVLAYPFKGGAGTELGSVLVKRGQELCPAVYQEGLIQFFAFPQSVFVAVTSTTRQDDNSQFDGINFDIVDYDTVDNFIDHESDYKLDNHYHHHENNNQLYDHYGFPNSLFQHTSAMRSQWLLRNCGTGWYGEPDLQIHQFLWSCGANNCAGSFNNNGASATCKKYRAGCACTPTIAMCGNSASCDAGGGAGSFDNNNALATRKGNWATCLCNPTANTCGNQASCDAGGCAGSFDNNGAYATCKGNWATCRCNPTQGTGGTCGACGSCDDENTCGSQQSCGSNGCNGQWDGNTVLLGVQGTLWDAAVRLLRGLAGPAVIVRTVIAIIVRAPLPVTTPTPSAQTHMRRATLIPRIIPAVIRKAAIRTGVMDNGTRVALPAVRVILSAVAVIRRGTHAAQGRAASAMAAPDEGVVIASGAVLGDTLLFRATTTLSGVILIGMRAGRVVDMNSDRTRTNASPNSDLLANLPSNWNNVASSITIISWVVCCQFYLT